LAVLLASALIGANSSLAAVAATTGVTAAVVQFLGLIRWPFLVPYLARADADADVSPARRETIDIVFQSFNRYLGVAEMPVADLVKDTHEHRVVGHDCAKFDPRLIGQTHLQRQPCLDSAGHVTSLAILRLPLR
jgi:hypothetical protein